MCGITGFLHRGGFRSDEATAVLRCMTDAIVHRGPDDAGHWVDGDAGVALGHRRLSIIDLSPTGHQPMESACGRFMMVYNGEIYNFKELRAELEPDGHRFRGTSDTEVMLAAFTAWGVDRAIERLNGMFAFAVWDRAERVLHLARDRGGEKPLYYGWSGGTFLFASELKAMWRHPRFRQDIDRDALALFVRHNYVPAPYSIYRGIRKLPPGTSVRIRPSDAEDMPEPIAYWSAREVAKAGTARLFRGSDEEAVNELDRLLADAVALRMEADVPLGAFLSGGIDSTTVVALMQAQSAQPVRTFTIGFHEQGYNEAEYAKAVARHLGTDHTELYVKPEEALAVIPRLPTMYDEPFSDSSQIPTFLVSELARQHVTVSLSGDAGDELFGGYNRYAVGREIWSRLERMPWPVRRAAAAALRAPSASTWDGLTRAIPPLARKFHGRNAGERAQQIADVLASRTPEGMYLKLVSHWDDPAGLVIGGTEPPTALAGSTELSDLTNRMMYLDTVSYLPDDILVKVDRASMAVSLESRVPLLDPRVIEFAWTLPISMKVRNGRGKWILREVLYRYVPRELIERPKMGFGVPIDQWLRGPLRDWAESLLDPRRLKEEGYFRPEPVRKKWEQHIEGRRDWHYHIWDILTFQAWLEARHAASSGRVQAAPEVG